MHRYIVKRLLLAIPTLAGAAALVFILMRLIPGDVCVIRLGSGGAHVDPGGAGALPRSSSASTSRWSCSSSISCGATSPSTSASRCGRAIRCAQEILLRLPVSLEVAVLATVIAILIAIPLGTISALKENYLARPRGARGGDRRHRHAVVLARHHVAHPGAQRHGDRTGKPWLPPIDYVPLWQDPIRNLSMVLLPAITVGYRYSAVTMRLTRSAMLEVMREDYIRTARAKGLLEQIIVNRHALKNALLPVVTLIGIEFAFLIGGLVITEQVFNLNGIGRLLVQAVQNQDNVLAQALVMLVVAGVRRPPTSWSTCSTPGSIRASAIS